MSALAPNLRTVTLLAALVYFFAAAAHAGQIPITGPIPSAAVVETILGVVLVAALVGSLSPRVAYGMALIGTLFGLGIVLLRGLGGFDLGVHFVMLALLGTGFVLMLGWRSGAR